MSAHDVRGAEFVVGAVDLYVHSAPDLLPRRCDDVALAAGLRDAGYAAAVHRHHFGPTAERASLAATETGFPLLGALLLNDCVGGLKPSAVDVALRMGAVWINLPTLSARHFRTLLPSMPQEIGEVLGLGGEVAVVDDSGRVVDSLVEIVDLVRQHDAVLATGYLTAAEVIAVVRCAVDRGLTRVVVSNPTSPAMRLSPADLEAVLAVGPDVYVEVSAYQAGHPATPGAAPDTIAQAAAALRLAAPERRLVSSDGGMANAPSPPELLAWVCSQLLDDGFTVADVSRMVKANPAALVGTR